MRAQKEPARFRQSHIVLISKLLTAEMVILAINILFKFSQLASSAMVPGGSDTQSLTLTGVAGVVLASIVQLICIVYITLDWTNNEYEIRDGAIHHRHGILYRKEEIYSLRNLGSAVITQSFWGKLFDFGSIHAYSPILKQEVHLLFVHNPKQILAHLEDDVEHSGGKHEIFRRG